MVMTTLFNMPALKIQVKPFQRRVEIRYHKWQEGKYHPHGHVVRSENKAENKGLFCWGRVLSAADTAGAPGMFSTVQVTYDC
jgi:hypothetical protein